jgi:hypothetical protein
VLRSRQPVPPPARSSPNGLAVRRRITTIGVDEHKMKPQNAAALVAAGMLSVLVLPILGRRPPRARTDPAAGEGAVPPAPTG